MQTPEFLPQLEPLPSPQPCKTCDATAYWKWCNMPFCYLHLLWRSRTLHKCYTSALNVVLSTPDVVEVSLDEIKMRIYPTTALPAICSILNQQYTLFPFTDAEAEIAIERWEDQPDGETLLHTGTGFYYLSSHTVHCHAPIIKLSREPAGTMENFLDQLNDYSRSIRTRMHWEHQGVAPNG